MLIVCPHCASTYDVERAALGAQGRSVRCGVCRTLWFVPVETAPTPRRASPASRRHPLTAKQKMDAVVRVCAILLMAMMGAGTGFAMAGEWPRWLIPLARSAGLEKPIWPTLERVVARLETSPEGASILSIEGEWLGGAQSGPTPAIEFDVRNSADEEVARWTDRSGPTKLAPGDRAPFRSRFAIPGGDAREVKARYVGFVPSRTE